MGLLVQLRQPKSVAVLPFDDASPGPGEVRLQILYSGISAGTELTQYRGLAPHLERLLRRRAVSHLGPHRRWREGLMLSSTARAHDCRRPLRGSA